MSRKKILKKVCFMLLTVVMVTSLGMGISACGNAIEQNSSDAMEQTISNVAPERWEYFVTSDSKLWDREARTYNTTFNALANEGWEFVGAFGGNYPTLVFRRRLQ